MKQFLATLVAALVGMFLALLLYDRFVVQPRAAKDADALARATEINLRKAQAEADAIAGNLDASIDQSVSDARKALDAQAGEQDKRRLAADALNRAAMFKVALSEHYVSAGKWPADARQAGLAPPKSFAGGAVSRIDVGANGAVIVTLDESLAAGAKIRLRPDADPESGVIDWHCSIEGSAALQRYLPSCRH
jgi:hypothetical protein